MVNPLPSDAREEYLPHRDHYSSCKFPQNPILTLSMAMVLSCGQKEDLQTNCRRLESAFLQSNSEEKVAIKKITRIDNFTVKPPADAQV